MTTHAAGGTNGRVHTRPLRATAELSTTRVLVRDHTDSPPMLEPEILIWEHQNQAPDDRSGLLERLRAFWFGETDLAPLGLFRIVYGVLLFNWVWQLFPNLTPFFTDEGMLPRSFLLSRDTLHFSLLNVVGAWWQVALFWLVGLIGAVMLTVGYRTRTASILAFLIVISFEWRNPLILDGSDLVFRLGAFWLIFTAAGARYSVDAALRRTRGEPHSGFGVALPVRILELQFAWIYLAAGLEKLQGTTWLDGTAGYYALQLKHTFGRALAEPLALNPHFSLLLSWFTLVMEIGFLLLAFSPILNRQARLLAILAAVMLQGGIALLMNVGNFPIIMLATLILFLPPDAVHGVVDRSRRLFPRSQIRLYYDGACHFCRRTTRFLGAVDVFDTITFVDFRTINTSKVGLGALALEKRIHAVDEQGRITQGFAAVACAARAIPLLFPLAVLRAPGLSRLAERAYDWVAERRLLLVGCPGGICALHPTPMPVSAFNLPPDMSFRWVRRVAYGLLLVVALCAFGTGLPKYLSAYKPPDGVIRLLAFVSLDQYWGMFAPDPARSDGWLLMPARLADGTELDLVTGGPLSDEPRYADPLYSRWAKVTERVVQVAYADYRLEYGRMHCRLRNWHLPAGESPLATFEVYYVERVMQPPGQGDPVLTKHHIWSHTC